MQYSKIMDTGFRRMTVRTKRSVEPEIILNTATSQAFLDPGFRRDDG